MSAWCKRLVADGGAATSSFAWSWLPTASPMVSCATPSCWASSAHRAGACASGEAARNHDKLGRAVSACILPAVLSVSSRPTTVARTCSSHHTGINANGFKTLAEGAKVSYDAEAGDKGPKAVNVTAL